MDKEMDEFISIGMKKYRGASATLVEFGREVERRLQAILLRRLPDEWSPFLPKAGKKLAKSTKYWSEYPLFNAKIDGELGGTPIRVMIAINWYQSERQYPFYFVTLESVTNAEDVKPYFDAMAAFLWSGNVTWNNDEGRLELIADENDFALERDFGILLDELVRFLRSFVKRP